MLTLNNTTKNYCHRCTGSGTSHISQIGNWGLKHMERPIHTKKLYSKLYLSKFIVNLNESKASYGTSVDHITYKYRVAYKLYVQCLGSINKRLENMLSANAEDAPASSSHSFHLAPCDIEFFSGDYLKWPSFRDLSTAVYVNNCRLSKVAKLFHLNIKTTADFKNIVFKALLTNESFDVA